MTEQPTTAAPIAVSRAGVNTCTVKDGRGPGRKVTTRSYLVDEAGVYVTDARDGQRFRLTHLSLTSEGDVWFFLVKVTRKGTDYRSGLGVNHSLSDRFTAERFPELAARLAATRDAQPADEALGQVPAATLADAEAALAARFPAGAEVRNTRTGLDTRRPHPRGSYAGTDDGHRGGLHPDLVLSDDIAPEITEDTPESAGTSDPRN